MIALGFTLQKLLHIVDQSSIKVPLKAAFTVDLDVVYLGRSAENALEFPFDAGYDALSVVDMATFKFEGRFLVKAN